MEWFVYSKGSFLLINFSEISCWKIQSGGITEVVLTSGHTLHVDVNWESCYQSNHQNPNQGLFGTEVLDLEFEGGFGSMT